ncbi:hypothetical protein RJ639_007081 [Escallonia herrerae]|uniref:DUF4050 domain-containing protein n=1 Tax=Escallonia herrerae TaxID=1293975 RepID=A0AA88VWA5_9ASTE|nr:hypothetical protein RJ639_007081 [Escallonia herrerae]
MGGCLGCDTKPKLITSVNEPLKGQKLQNWTLSKPSISEDFWTTSICDMDNSAAQSRGSISSISTSNQAHDAHGTGSGNIPSEFVNHGKFGIGGGSLLHLTSLHSSIIRIVEYVKDYDWDYNNASPYYPRSVNYQEMVDFLVDIWEQEGMYD